jgi:hypothetical protein
VQVARYPFIKQLSPTFPTGGNEEYFLLPNQAVPDGQSDATGLQEGLDPIEQVVTPCVFVLHDDPLTGLNCSRFDDNFEETLVQLQLYFLVSM